MSEAATEAGQFVEYIVELTHRTDKPAVRGKDKDRTGIAMLRDVDQPLVIERNTMRYTAKLTDVRAAVGVDIGEGLKPPVVITFVGLPVCADNRFLGSGFIGCMQKNRGDAGNLSPASSFFSMRAAQRLRIRLSLE